MKVQNNPSKIEICQFEILSSGSFLSLEFWPEQASIFPFFFLGARAEKFFRRAPYFATVDSNLEM